MVSLKFVLFVYLSVLQFEGVSPEIVYIDRFSRAGQDTTLSCDRFKQHGPSCSSVDWFYNKDSLSSLTEVRKGQIEVNSPRSSRLRLNPDCSLTVHNVTDEDSGTYTCRVLNDQSWDTVIYLSVLTVSPAPSLNPNQDGLITFSCNLDRYSRRLGPCGQNSFRWLDETGTVLSGDGIIQNNCVSYLTVERQSEHRKHTCEYVDEKNNTLISADYTPERGNTGVSPETVFINHFSRVGQDVTLSCDRAAQQGPTCSRVDWIYNRDFRSALTEVRKGKVEKNSPRSSRLRLNTDCSLTVHNVTDEDSGGYDCRLFDDDYYDTVVHLSVLSVSPTEPQLNGLMRLTCTLKRYSGLDSCEQNSFRWLDETGTVLSGDGITQNTCVSYLTVERQSEHRKHTCQYVDKKNNTLISADYTPEVNREGKTVSSGSPGSTEIFIGVGAVVSLLVLLVVGVVVFFKIRAKRSAAETTEDTEGDVNPGDSAVDLENNVTYARINHQKAPEKKNQVVMEENTVTYSAVNIKTEPDSRSIYSNVNKTKV